MENTINKLNYCRICNSLNISPLFIKSGYEVSRCLNCSLVFLNFRPSAQFLKDYYAEDFFNDSGSKHGFSDYEKEKVSLQKTFGERLKIIRKYKDGGKLLDVGCATGTFLEEASKYFEAYGSEISAYATKVAQEKNLNVLCGDLPGTPFMDMGFDVVTLWDTIEHLENPVEMIRTIGKITSPGSVVILTTGDVEGFVAKLSGRYWHLYNIPQHLSYFSQITVAAALKAGGFILREVTYPSVNFTLDYLLFRLVTFYKIGKLLPLYAWLKNKRLLDASVKINLFDIMMVVAQKE